MFSNSFNLTQFIDVTTDQQAKQGSTMFEDLNNPGDYYIETKSGMVYSINKTRIITNTRGKFTDEIDTTQHCINPRNIQRRGRSNGYSKLMTRTERLARIQHVSDQRANRGYRVISSSSPNEGRRSVYMPW